DVGASHLHGGGDLVVVVVEFLGQQVEALDLRHLGQAGVALGDLGLDKLVDLGVLGQAAEGGVGDAFLLAPFGDGIEVDLDQGRDVAAPFGDDDALLDIGARLDGAFDLRGREVLAAGGDHDVLEAVDDAQAAVDPFPHVAGVQPAVTDSLPGGGLVLVVTLEDQAAAHQHLVLLAEAHLGPQHRSADGADDDVVRPLAGDYAGGLGLAVDFDERDADGAEEAQDVWRDRGSARQRDAAASQADVVLQGAEDQ